MKLLIQVGSDRTDEIVVGGVGIVIHHRECVRVYSHHHHPPSCDSTWRLPSVNKASISPALSHPFQDLVLIHKFIKFLHD